jgi:hypothetical protein
MWNGLLGERRRGGPRGGGDLPAAGGAAEAGATEKKIRFHERRRFGSLVVARDSAAALPFTVAP